MGRASITQRFEQEVVPAALVDVEEQRPRRIGGVGDVRASAGEPPDEERIDRTEGELTRL